MKHRVQLFVAAIACMLGILGCSSPSGSEDSKTGYYLSAKVDGESFSALELTCKGSLNSGFLTFAGTAGTTTPKQVNITVPGAESGKTYTVSLGSALVMVMTTGISATEVYTANPVAGTGKITLNTVTDTYAEGTFEFTGFNVTGASKKVTEGKFKVTLD